MADVGFTQSTRLCVIVCVLSSLFVSTGSLDLSCIEVKKEYVKMGFTDDSSVPISAIPGDHLRICPRGSTCCTSDMEDKLKSISMKEYETVSNGAFRIMKSTFVSRTKKFDEFFTELLEKSKKDLHETFVRAYGLLYQQNAEVFSDLFRDLKQYYKGSDVNLVDILNSFFEKLLQRMFELLNSQYMFDKGYLSCVTRHMDKLKPFGDVPQRLKQQVKRAFVAARTFVQGLAIGRDVILAMERVKPTEACTLGMTRMMYCPHCRGLTRTKPCLNFCLNTMKGCLAHHSELNKAWNEYIKALEMVAERLEGPFNIETVVDPIDVKISEAIMNFQEDSKTVTEMIFKGCGMPRRIPDRPKRDAQSYEDYAYGKNFMSNNRGSQEREDTAAGTNLDRLVKDIKDKVKEAKNFWVQLPYAICNGPISAQPGQDEDCWNGQDRARYPHDVQKDGRMYQHDNPEVTVDVQEENGIISVQIYNLKLITGKLHNAYNGIDVEWTGNIDIDSSGDDLEMSGDHKKGGVDDEDDLVTGSGQGGTITHVDVVEDKGDKYHSDDEDYDNTDHVYSGSGSGDQPPIGYDPPVRVDVTRRPPHYTRQPPHRINPGSTFVDPTYTIKRDPQKPKKPTKDNNKSENGVSMVTANVFLLTTTTIVCLRLVL